MSAIQLAGRVLETNKKGYLVNFDDWNREIAEAMARAEGLELTDCHWAVIGFLRNYYAEYEVPPSNRTIVKTIGDQLTVDATCNSKTLEALFHGGGCKQACRIAGLPDYYCHHC